VATLLRLKIVLGDIEADIEYLAVSDLLKLIDGIRPSVLGLPSALPAKYDFFFEIPDRAERQQRQIPRFSEGCRADERMATDISGSAAQKSEVNLSCLQPLFVLEIKYHAHKDDDQNHP
jgi:hypothetical protein